LNSLGHGAWEQIKPLIAGDIGDAREAQGHEADAALPDLKLMRGVVRVLVIPVLGAGRGILEVE
jgi:hypothetical protein